MTNNHIDLNQIFENRQAELQARLERVRDLPHPTAKGDEGENGWREILRDFLPERYSVDRHRFIIDSDGQVSEQQDIVIYDPVYAPTFLVIGDTQFIPIESVYAVLEVKPELNRDTIRQAGQKAESVRRLEMHPGQFAVLEREADGDLEFKSGQGSRPPHPVLAGIVCRTTGYKSLDSPAFRKALREETEDKTLDIGCVASHGAFLVVSDEIQLSRPDHALIAFCVSLFDTLQKVGNATAVDAQRYAKISSGSGSSPNSQAPRAKTSATRLRNRQPWPRMVTARPGYRRHGR